MNVVLSESLSNAKPHGGVLINKEPKQSEKIKILAEAKKMVSITLSPWEISDVELIGIGGFSPLTGFMKETDYLSVIHDVRLENGLVWSIPITLSVSKSTSDQFSIGQNVALKGADGIMYAVLKLEEKYHYNKRLEAQKVYGTTDEAHPGVKKIYEQGDVYLAGPITLLNRPDHGEFASFYKDPRETMEMFTKLGWQTIVGFQTRNPVHRAHEYIQKV